MRDVTDPVYGATGDGVTDDTAAIQAALDVGPGVVVIPPGSYKLSAALLLGPSLTVLARGAYLYGSGHHRLTTNFPAGANTPVYSGNGDIAIVGGVWDVKGQNAAMETASTPAEGYNVMSFTHAARITLDGVTLRNVAWCHAVELNAIDTARVVGCRAEGFRDTSLAQNRDHAEAFQVDAAVAGSTSCLPHDNTTCRDITIDNCYAGPSADLGTWGALTGSHTGKGLGIWYDRIRVVNSHVDGTLLYGVHGEAWRDYVVAGNTFKATGGTAIFMDGCTGGIISGNTVRDAGSNGVNITGTNGAIVSDNSINTTGAYGVYLLESDGVGVRGNWLYGAATAAVKISTGCNGVQVTGNTLRPGSPVALIHAPGSGVNTFHGNDVDGYGTAPGVIDNTSGTLVTNIANHAVWGENVA